MQSIATGEIGNLVYLGTLGMWGRQSEIEGSFILLYFLYKQD